MANNNLETNTTGEGDFNFNSWITQNGLDEVKDLFEKHGLIKPEYLTIGSNEFKSLMTDPLLYQKSHMMPMIMDAMQTIMIQRQTKLLSLT